MRRRRTANTAELVQEAARHGRGACLGGRDGGYRRHDTAAIAGPPSRRIRLARRHPAGRCRHRPLRLVESASGGAGIGCADCRRPRPTRPRAPRDPRQRSADACRSIERNRVRRPFPQPSRLPFRRHSPLEATAQPWTPAVAPTPAAMPAANVETQERVQRGGLEHPEPARGSALRPAAAPNRALPRGGDALGRPRTAPRGRHFVHALAFGKPVRAALAMLGARAAPIV